MKPTKSGTTSARSPRVPTTIWSFRRCPLALFDNSLEIALAKVKAILLVNLADSDGEDLVVGAAASDEWLGPFGRSGDSLTVPAGASLLLVNQKSGWPVSAGSADTLRITNAGHSDIDYKIAVLGTSA